MVSESPRRSFASFILRRSSRKMRPMPVKKNTTPPKDFQEAISELEQILREIERGEVGLEDSLVKYERGNFLIQHCQGILNTAERQIEQVTKSPDGSLKATPAGEP